MALYLVQHGKAESKEEDPDRPLTQEGAREVRKVAAFLESARLQVPHVWHSGKTRARQTAQKLAPAAGGGEVAERDDLGATDPVGPVADALRQAGGAVLVVGHLPFLDTLASLLVAGSEDAGVVEFQNGGVVCLELEESGEARLRWIVTPQILP
jgi:phosphohistidine phosphatase